ncbi:hypothetical protein [Rhizobium leucaenae]|uniref:Uncharacterized protein n=1 Tax=Rhizobium leucaenae TaxID=29450 RepID=A0A7W6ZXZ9_9HYPH|nr:hypothetical protein [Rhizobium leucaenae]MBB4570605.1 hypothetical protein [Rhizobium leucaenae]MBB6304631.1 hypothetical protein [Rhizobium leucaenae]
MDLTQVEGILGLASTALGATGKAVSTVEAIKNLMSSEKKLDNDKAATLLNTLAVELTAANMMNVNLSTGLKELSQQLKSQNEFEKDKARYELFQTGQNDLVYKLKEEMAEGQPMHFICPVCLNSDKQISFISGEGDYKRCQKDKKHMFRFKNTPLDLPPSGRWHSRL